jgi:hypothetical protein
VRSAPVAPGLTVESSTQSPTDLNLISHFSICHAAEPNWRAAPRFSQAIISLKHLNQATKYDFGVEHRAQERIRRLRYALSVSEPEKLNPVGMSFVYSLVALFTR